MLRLGPQRIQIQRTRKTHPGRVCSSGGFLELQVPRLGVVRPCPGSLLLSYLPVLPLLVVVRLITEIGSRGRGRACGRSWIRGEIGTDQIVFFFCLFISTLTLTITRILLGSSLFLPTIETAIEMNRTRYPNRAMRNNHLHPHFQSLYDQAKRRTRPHEGLLTG
jgi:hypothetical protein